MTRSFRDVLALRFALITTAGMALCVLATFLALRAILDAELDASILNVASIQAAALTDARTGEMHFHEWDLTPQEAESVRPLVRYAQVWSAGGESLLRSRYMLDDLPVDPVALTAASAGDIVWREADFEAYPVRSVYYPLVRLGHLHHEHVLQVAAPLDARNAMLRRVGVFGVVMVLLTAVASILGGRWLATRAIRPVTEIIEQAEGMGGGTLRRRISAWADTREYERLVQVLNTMLSRIEESFESQRRFTADASHELRTPLTALRGELELALRRERPGEEYREVLRSAHEEVLHLGRIVEGLLTLARSDAGAFRLRREPAALEVPVREALERAAPEAGRQGVVVEAHLEPIQGSVDPGLFLQLVANLLGNAIRHAGPDGRVRITLAAGGGSAVLEVEDSGPGLPPGAGARVFDRFWRGDPSRTPAVSGQGTGLGLAIVKVIAEAHGGRVSAEDGSPLGGARLRVELPLDSGERGGRGARSVAAGSVVPEATSSI